MASAAFLRPVIVAAKALALLAVLAALAACARGVPGYSGPIHGDNKPHAGVDRARGLPIQGIDVARYQGRVAWDAVRGSGIHFAYVKGTEGKDYIDPNFYANWDGARAAGIARGVYHFMTWCSLAAQQAAWFVRNVPQDPGALPPVLDLEWNNHSSCKNKHSRADILEKIRVMLAAMEAHTGKVPVIYTDINFHRDILAGESFDNPFWLRSTAAEPHQRYRDRRWTFWQWTQTGSVRGINHEVDRNAFYGTQDEWVTFLLTGCDPRLLQRLGPQGRCQAK
jgi:lysozyme